MILFQMIKTIYFLYNCIYYKFNDDNYIDKLIDNIDKSGCLFIKIVQWILPRIESSTTINNNIKNKLSKYYDKCNIHSIDYTKEIYKKEFDSCLSLNYDIIDIIGSGSMGQVYKIKHLKTNRIYAMKVLHPDIKYQYYMFYILFNIILFFIDIKKFIPVSDINNILIDLKKQLNLINEANNLLQLKSINSNDIFLLPDVIKMSKNILIMSYIECENKENITEYKQESIVIKLLLFLLANSYYGISHADLHKGNWGISKNKIVIYDFGYCNNYKEDFIYGERFILNDNRLNSFHSFIVKYLILSNISKTKHQKILNLYDEEVKSKLGTIYVPLKQSLKHLLQFFHKYNILIDCKSLNALLDSNNIESINMGKIDAHQKTSDLFLEQLIELCDAYNCYKEYKNHIIKEYNYKKKYKFEEISKKYDFLKDKII